MTVWIVTATVALAVLANLSVGVLVWRERRRRQELGADIYAASAREAASIVRPLDGAVPASEWDANRGSSNMFDEFDRQMREDAHTPVEVPTPAAIAATKKEDK
jgi:hypothetical protein